jgi:hypothetical protein
MRVWIAILGLLAALPQGAAAHDIPNDVTVQMFLKPSGDKLDVLVRNSVPAIWILLARTSFCRMRP